MATCCFFIPLAFLVIPIVILIGSGDYLKSEDKNGESQQRENSEVFLEKGKPLKKKRPAIITVVCIFGFIGLLITIPAVFTNIVKQFGLWFQAFLVIHAIALLVCIIGLWNMKKWAVILYMALSVIVIVVSAILGHGSIQGLIFPVIFVIFLFSKYKEME